MKIGYARVSTDDQHLELQLDALRRSGVEKIYEEKISGKNTDRPEFQACLKSLRKGDTLVTWRLDRLGRSLKDLISTINDLKDKGITFESLHEKIDTSTATGALTFHLFGALAEFERNLISERTRAGLAAARARGRKGGRKPKLDEKQRETIKKLMQDKSVLVTEIARMFGVARSTVYKI